MFGVNGLDLDVWLCMHGTSLSIVAVMSLLTTNNSCLEQRCIMVGPVDRTKVRLGICGSRMGVVSVVRGLDKIELMIRHIANVALEDDHPQLRE